MLTPVDIQNHTLKTTMGGYNKKDTEEFLASVLDSYETLFRENRDLKEKISSLSEGIQYYKQMENTLQKALVLAEKTASETQEAAKTQADSIISDAQAEAGRILKDKKAEADRLVAEAERRMKDAEAKSDALIKDAEAKASLVVKDAEKNSGGLVLKSKTEADTILKEAEIKSGELIKKAEKQAENLKAQTEREIDGIRISAVKLVQDYERYKEQFKKLVTAQLELLGSEEFQLSASVTGQPDTIANNKGNNAGMDKTEKTKEKFTWNNDGNAATEEPENANPFTFIDTE